MGVSKNVLQEPASAVDHASAWQTRTPVAPTLHTAVLIAVLVAFSVLSSGSQRTFSARHGQITLYISTIIWEWLIVGYIALGLRRRGLRLLDLVAGRWRSLAEVLRDTAVAVGFWFVAWMVLAWLGYALGLANSHATAEAREKLSFMVPRSTSQLALFLGLSATAGFCEEIIFRGYLQRQFAALTRSELVAVLLQAVIFGAGHGYEGRARMLLIAVYGVMFGMLALWRRSLRPGMIAHGMHDAVEGILLRRFF